MRNIQTDFEDTCEISSIKTGITVTGEILNFKENDFIIASINRSAKVHLRWRERSNLYIGSMGGVEFSSLGPTSYTYRTSR